MSTSSPMRSSHQPRRYRLVDQHGQPHLELDEHFDSIEEAWAFATNWWQKQQPAGEPATQVGLGLEVSTSLRRGQYFHCRYHRKEPLLHFN